MHSQLEVENLLQPDQVAKLNEIGDLIAQGNKNGAIKLYREVFDTSLIEAKVAVEQLAEGKAITQIAVIPDDEGLHNRNDLTEAEIRQLLQEGKKIEAIKCYRETYHTGLKESKEAIEVYETSGVLPVPTLKMDVEAAQEIIDAIQKFAQSTGTENPDISAQTSSVDRPIGRASRPSARFDWWLTCS